VQVTAQQLGVPKLVESGRNVVAPPRSGNDNQPMQDDLRLGQKLKQFRLAMRLRLKEVAEAAECSEGMLSKLENGKVTPSIGLLHRLASVLGTNVSALFEQNQTGVVTRAGTRPNISQGDSQRQISLELLTPVPSPTLFQSAIYTIAPKARSDGKITHVGEDFGYVFEGQLELYLDDETHLLGPGDAFYFPSDRPHGYSNPGDTVTKLIWFNTPPTF
jgi:transcriptional regulator with XRE-family HTH domain